MPREAVGIIIGKGGEMIKTIQGKFNVRIQFQNDSGGPQRMCDVSGSANDVFAAKQHVNELINENQVLAASTTSVCYIHSSSCLCSRRAILRLI